MPTRRPPSPTLPREGPRARPSAVPAAGLSGAWLRPWTLAISLAWALTLSPAGQARADDAPQPAPAPAPADAPAPAPAPASPEPQVPPEPQPEVPPEAEPEAVVTMRDGSRFTGLLIARDDRQVVLRIAGLRQTFKTSTVERVELLPPVVERYRRLRAAIDPDDLDQRFQLVDWLLARQRLDLAKIELDELAQRRPGHPVAERRRQEVTALLALREKPRPAPAQDRLAAPGGAERPDPDDDADRDDAPGPAPVPLLSPYDANLIKVFEVNLARPPRLDVPRQTIDALLEQHAGNPLLPDTREGRDALYREHPARLLELLFRLRARELYGSVRVIDQPEAVRRFRDDVQRAWMINACATTACHGGAEAGRFVLATRRPGAEPAVLTNLLILDRYRLADGTPLINYDQPQRSPLIHLGLPRELSAHPHPLATRGPAGQDAWRPLFRDLSDPRVQATVDWIRSMYRPRPAYPVEYTPLHPFDAPQPGAAPGPAAAPPAPPVER